jgi:hypothetical protein
MRLRSSVHLITEKKAMKQSVVFLIVMGVIVGAAVGGFTLWRNSQDRPAEMGGVRDLEPAAARKLLLSVAGVAIPENASDLSGCQEMQFERWIAIRFDMPAADAAAWAANSAKIAKMAEGKAAAEARDEMGYCSTWVNRPWWDLAELNGVSGGQAEGAAKTAAGQSKWHLRTCMSNLPDNKTRVYVLFMDDAVSATRPAK